MASDAMFFDPRDQAIALYSSPVLRRVEQDSARRLGPHALMERAAAAAAELARELMGSASPGTACLVFAGPGNNGGDALLCAVRLKAMGLPVRVYLPLPSAGEDALWAYAGARAAGVEIFAQLPSRSEIDGCALAIDGLFGIGLKRGLAEPFSTLASHLAHRAGLGAPVLALDVPSGIDADTGMIAEGAGAVVATHTITFIGAKPGLYTGVACDHVGALSVAPLGLVLSEERSATVQERIGLNAPARFRAAFPERRKASNKGTFGSVAVIGGAHGTCGAVILAARAALFCGAGKVHAVMLGEDAPAYDSMHPEIMIHKAGALDMDTMRALAVGPGMGTDARAKALLAELLKCDADKVLDADALNLIALEPALADVFKEQGEHVVITPHPGEAARLLGTDVATVQGDRLHAARRLHERYRCNVVLKGAGTVVVAWDGRTVINPTGNAGLATGGTGDTLTGIIGAFLAQRLPAFEATLAAVFMHGRAAERLVERGVGPIGLSAGELPAAVRELLNEQARVRASDG